MERIIIVHWNKSTGPEPIIQYPPEQKFPSNELFLKIWALHELDKESSIIEFIPDINEEQFISIIQKYEEEIYFIILAYNRKDKIKDMITEHPDILAIVSKNLIELINTNKITRTISEAFHTIKYYTKLEKEENLLNFFRDKIKFTILNILQEGVISKDKLNEILRKEYGFSTTNIDLLMISFIRENLIIKRNVPGSRECYFLVKDLSCIRIPPKDYPKGFQDNDEISNDYREKIIKFHANYDYISEIENKSIINFLMNKEVYSLLEKLRIDSSISVTNCLDILNNKEDLFNELLNKKIIYEAKGNVTLFSDIRFIKFTPFYIFLKLSTRYNHQEISLNEYLMHINLLTAQYEKQESILDYEII
jgi:hypothetical protein